MDERTVLVGGGSGEVGEGVVATLLAAGHRVVVPTRSAASVDDIAARAGDAGDLLTVEVADLADPAAAADLRDRLAADGRAPTDVVASLGGWWSGPPLVEVEPATWHEVLTMGLHAHFVCARTFLPVLAERGAGTYVLINGGGATGPVPGSGPVNVSAAGQLMLGRVLAAELDGTGVAVRTLVAQTPVLSRSRPSGRDDWLTAAVIGRVCAALVAGGDVDVVTTLTGEAAAAQLAGRLERQGPGTRRG